MIKLLIGGSPCTFWSIAQKNNRETEAEGLGWELFKNYLIAKEKFQPDFFLYENNKSASQAIKDQISRELGVEIMHINSALVSAQNRQRFYAFNWEVDQPADRGILLKDILESGENLTGGDKSYALTTRCVGAIPEDTIKRHRHTMVAEPVSIGYRNRREEDGKLYRRFETSNEPKANALTTVQTDSMIATPIRIGTLPNSKGEIKDAQATRIYSIDGKGVNLVANGGGQGAKTGLYAIPSEKEKDIYEVKDGLIEIKGRKFPIWFPYLENIAHLYNVWIVTHCNLYSVFINLISIILNIGKTHFIETITPRPNTVIHRKNDDFFIFGNIF